PQNDVTLKMPAFEWVHVQLHQQKGMISLSPPTICNSAADNITGHCDIAPVRKTDPGPAFDWAKYRGMLAASSHKEIP
ncbi:hypothetical protein ACU6ZT_21780, partial [Klebsiella aerogenes]